MVTPATPLECYIVLSFIQVVWFMIYHLHWLSFGRSDSPFRRATSLPTVAGLRRTR